MKMRSYNFCHTNTKNPGNNLGVFCLITGRPKLNGYVEIISHNRRSKKTTQTKKGLNSCVRTQPYRKTLMFPFHFLNGFCQLLQSLPDDGTWFADVEPHVACTSWAEHLAVVEGKMGFVDKQIE